MRTEHQYRLCGERKTRDAWIPWEGTWRIGEGPSTPNEHYDARKYAESADHRNVRWEARTVTYSEVTTTLVAE